MTLPISHQSTCNCKTPLEESTTLEAKLAMYRESSRRYRASHLEKERERDRKRSREKARKWRASHLESERARVRKWAAEHVDHKKDRERKKKEYYANIERSRKQAREKNRKRRELFPERERECGKKWRANNPYKARENYLRKRLRRLNALGSVTASDIARLYEIQGGRCANLNCYKSLKCGYHLDHMEPVCSSLDNRPENIQLLCPMCNQKKYSKSFQQWCTEEGMLGLKRYV